jgi:hypothetical protein
VSRNFACICEYLYITSNIWKSLKTLPSIAIGRSRGYLQLFALFAFCVVFIEESVRRSGHGRDGERILCVTPSWQASQVRAQKLWLSRDKSLPVAHTAS